jgi:hypothetical protein
MSTVRKIIEIALVVVLLVVGVGAIIIVIVRWGGGAMQFWKIAGTIALAGLLGGVINSLLSDSGLFLPGWDEVDQGRRIFKLGALGNAFLGAAAAFISWGLYGPFSKYVIIPPGPVTDLNLDVATLVGAIVAGSGGSRLITSALDKRVLAETAATAAAGTRASPAAAASIATASPTEALATARRIPGAVDPSS